MSERTTIRVELREASAESKSYGVTHKSRYVYSTSRGHYPTRVEVWSNVDRPNPRNGEPVRWGQYGKLDGGNGRYLDPGHDATDAPVTVLLTPESTIITSDGTNTGTEASGQVYASGVTIRTGDVLCLIYPDGREESWTVRFTRNGHGEADPVSA